MLLEGWIMPKCVCGYDGEACGGKHGCDWETPHCSECGRTF